MPRGPGGASGGAGCQRAVQHPVLCVFLVAGPQPGRLLGSTHTRGPSPMRAIQTCGKGAERDALRRTTGRRRLGCAACRGGVAMAPIPGTTFPREGDVPQRPPNRLAAMLNRGWAVVGTAGLWPNRLVTLEVRGRRSGRLVSFPLVVADYEGERYLVAMLGERANWVANVRAAGGRRSFAMAGGKRCALRRSTRALAPRSFGATCRWPRVAGHTSQWIGERQRWSSSRSARRSPSSASPPAPPTGRTRATRSRTTDAGSVWLAAPPTTDQFRVPV